VKHLGRRDVADRPTAWDIGGWCSTRSMVLALNAESAAARRHGGTPLRSRASRCGAQCACFSGLPAYMLVTSFCGHAIVDRQRADGPASIVYYRDSSDRLADRELLLQRRHGESLTAMPGTCRPMHRGESARHATTPPRSRNPRRDRAPTEHASREGDAFGPRPLRSRRPRRGCTRHGGRATLCGPVGSGRARPRRSRPRPRTPDGTSSRSIRFPLDRDSRLDRSWAEPMRSTGADTDEQSRTGRTTQPRQDLDEPLSDRRFYNRRRESAGAILRCST
jgi:hypothetical protein